MRLAAQSKGGFYPTTPRVVDLIAQLIRVPSGYYYRNREVLRILDPCCGAGEAVAQLAERLSQPGSAPVETCGVELHRDRAEQAEGRLDRTLAADLFQTSIANGAFGLAFVNPPYDHDAEKKRTEHSFLVHYTRYLTENGLLVFIVPRRRLAVSARYLAAHYQRLRCWAFPDPERQVFDQVVLAGYRKMEPQPGRARRAAGQGVDRGRATCPACRYRRAVRQGGAVLTPPIRSSTLRQHRRETSCSRPALSIRRRQRLGSPGGLGCGPAPRSPTPCGRRAVRIPDR